DLAPGRVVGLVALEVILGRERQLGQVFEVLDLLGPHARRVELFSVEGAVGVGVSHLLAQLALLETPHRLGVGRLDLRLQVTAVHHALPRSRTDAARSGSPAFGLAHDAADGCPSRSARSFSAAARTDWMIPW